jgi:hypothetical protein
MEREPATIAILVLLAILEGIIHSDCIVVTRGFLLELVKHILLDKEHAGIVA